MHAHLACHWRAARRRASSAPLIEARAVAKTLWRQSGRLTGVDFALGAGRGGRPRRPQRRRQVDADESCSPARSSAAPASFRYGRHRGRPLGRARRRPAACAACSRNCRSAPISRRPRTRASSIPGLQGFGWRRRARALITAALDDIFPGHGIDPGAKVGRRSPSASGRWWRSPAPSRRPTHRCAASSSTSRPPRSATGRRSNCSPISARRRRAASRCILITHRLNEILAVSRPRRRDDGRRRWSANRPAAEPHPFRPGRHDGRHRGPRRGRHAGATAQADGRVSVVDHAGRGRRRSPRPRPSRRDHRLCRPRRPRPARSAARHLCRDARMCRWPMSPATAERRACSRCGRSPTISTIRSLKALRRGGFVPPSAVRALAEDWSARLKVKAPRCRHADPLARAAATSRRCCSPARSPRTRRWCCSTTRCAASMSAPSRRSTRLIRTEADKGRTFVWYTTEMDELTNCGRLYVFREGRAGGRSPRRGDQPRPHPRSLLRRRATGASHG